MTSIKESYKTIMDDHFPGEITLDIGGQKLMYRKRTWKIPQDGEVVEKGLRYGENPGQEAALYELVNGNLILGDCRFIESGRGLTSSITEEMMLQAGKHPGKTNLTDIDNSLNILKYLDNRPAAIIVKHNNPSGVAYGSTSGEAFTRAFMADRIAAFGGCLALNRAIDPETAELINNQFLEVVVAPDFTGEALDILKQRKNLRIVQIRDIERLSEYRTTRFIDIKSLIDGGLILQQSPLNKINSSNDFLPATVYYKDVEYQIERKPTPEELDDLLFGWSVEQGVTSNSVLYVKDGTTVGIGTGEQDRVGVAEIAIQKAYTKFADRVAFERHGRSYKDIQHLIQQGDEKLSILQAIDEETKEAKGGLSGSRAVSDAFFPFRDGVDVIIEQGITAIVHPGGSMRDHESIQACNEADPRVTMVFTGQRAFKH